MNVEENLAEGKIIYGKRIFSSSFTLLSFFLQESTLALAEVQTVAIVM